MAKLENVFSWSHSAASDFETCRRKRYWSKYGAWGGWERDASPICKTAYRLNKMTNRFCMYGIAAEDAVMWMLQQHQRGREVSVKEAYDTVARPLLRKAWDESKGKVWMGRPKAACFHEHYYPRFCELEDLEIMKEIAAVVNACLENFKSRVWPRLAHVTPEMEIPIATVGKGDAEHFILGGIKIYAIPDYIFVEDGIWNILDWKSGSRKESHKDQLTLYALWAKVKHNIPPENVRLQLEYLQTGEYENFVVTEEDLTEKVAQIRESVQDMGQYLEGGDLKKNCALPKVEWDLCYEMPVCRGCSFFELCHSELKDALGDEVD